MIHRTGELSRLESTEQGLRGTGGRAGDWQAGPVGPLEHGISLAPACRLARASAICCLRRPATPHARPLWLGWRTPAGVTVALQPAATDQYRRTIIVSIIV